MRKYLKAGDYDTLQNSQNFAERLTDDIWSIYHDSHFSVRYSPLMAKILSKGSIENDLEEIKKQLQFGRSLNYGFIKKFVRQCCHSWP